MKGDMVGSQSLVLSSKWQMMKRKDFAIVAKNKIEQQMWFLDVLGESFQYECICNTHVVILTKDTSDVQE